MSKGPSTPNIIPLSLKSFCSRKPVPNTIALEGLDASNIKAEEDERAIINATSNFNEGRIAMQIGTSKVVAVELVITLARIIAKNPKMEISTILFNCKVIRSSE